MLVFLTWMFQLDMMGNIFIMNAFGKWIWWHVNIWKGKIKHNQRSKPVAGCCTYQLTPVFSVLLAGFFCGGRFSAWKILYGSFSTHCQKRKNELSFRTNLERDKWPNTVIRWLNGRKYFSRSVGCGRNVLVIFLMHHLFICYF